MKTLTVSSLSKEITFRLSVDDEIISAVIENYGVPTRQLNIFKADLASYLGAVRPGRAALKRYEVATNQFNGLCLRLWSADLSPSDYALAVRLVRDTMVEWEQEVSF